jgi:hypothetical protein
VRIDGHVSGLGKVKHREFAMASGEMTEAEFAGFLKLVFANLVGASVDGSIHFVAMDWRHVAEVMTSADGTYAALKNLCVWSKTNGGMGSLYRSHHELFFVFKAGTALHINNVGARSARPLPHERLAVCRRQRLQRNPRRRPRGESYRQTGRARYRRNPRLLKAQGHCARRLRWLGHDAGLRAQDRPERLRHRTRPALLRRHPSPHGRYRRA